MCGNNNQNMLQLAEHYNYAFPKICLFRFQLHLTLYLTPLQLVSAIITCQMSKDCLVPVWARAKSLDIDKSLGSPNETSMSGCRDFSSRPRCGDENHQQHQKGPPYSSLAGCDALKEGGNNQFWGTYRGIWTVACIWNNWRLWKATRRAGVW